MLQSACGFIEEGNKRMTKGLAEKNLDEIDAAQKIIQLAQEKQQKVQDELKIVHKEKRKLKLGEKVTKKTKSQVNVCFKIYYFLVTGLLLQN